MKLISLVSTTSSLLALTSLSAMPSIPTSYVGDINNPNDSSGYGGVSYGYYIGTYEVTNAEYAAFLNAVAATDTYGLYNSNMSLTSFGGINRNGSSGSFSYSVKSGMEDSPVNYVSFWDAARFTNWMTTGGTETGVYNLGGVATPANGAVNRDATAFAEGGVAIANQDEWYKAAYYQPALAGGDVDGYWDYPTMSNTISTADANYANSVGNVTEVGSYSGNYYGVFDQGGNVWEWTEEILNINNRALRGGALNTVGGDLLANSSGSFSPTSESGNVGFRVVSTMEIVPEPSAFAAIFGLFGLTMAFCRRSSRV